MLSIIVEKHRKKVQLLEVNIQETSLWNIYYINSAAEQPLFLVTYDYN